MLLSRTSDSLPQSTPSRGPAILISVITLQIFATTFYFARVVSRVLLLRRWQLDDTLLTIAWVMGVLLAALTCASVPHGAGSVQSESSLEDIIANIKYGYLTRIFYISTLAFTKLSICVFYLRIFSTTRVDCWIIRGCIAFILLSFLPTLIVTIFPCTPITKLWNWTPQSGAECLSDPRGFWASAIVNLISDVWILLVVSYRLFRVQLAPLRKLVTILIISTGWFIVVACILRMVRVSTIIYKVDYDFAWVSYEIYLWTAVEANVGIFCAAAPTLKPLIIRMTPAKVHNYMHELVSGAPLSNGRIKAIPTGTAMTGLGSRHTRLPTVTTPTQLDLDDLEVGGSDRNGRVDYTQRRNTNLELDEDAMNSVSKHKSSPDVHIEDEESIVRATEAWSSDRAPPRNNAEARR